VVIPCHEKDAAHVERALESVRACVQDVRRIIVVSSESFTDAAEWFDESLFPFSKESLALEIFKSPEAAQRYLRQKESRVGWLYQQFLKLYAQRVIPDISSNVLIVDADMVFLKSMKFVQDSGAGLYAVGTEYRHSYFVHMARLLPGLTRLYPHYSGITNHMLFQKPVLDDLFLLIEREHGCDAWKALARAIPVYENGTINGAAMSEYEIYFNFVFARTDQVKIRPAKWTYFFDENLIKKHKEEGYDYVTVHFYQEDYEKMCARAAAA
jgi:hypothetical protein